MTFQPQQAIEFTQIGAKDQSHKSSHTIVEAPVSLTVNGEVWTKFMCTPIHLEAMMVGFLFNEGMLDHWTEVSDVRVCQHGDNVDVWLTHDVEKPESWTRTSGCSGGVTAVDTIERPRSVTAIDANTDPSEFTMAPAQIHRMVEMLFDSQELYRETGGVHTSALTDGDQVLISAEDIGRHNSLDKIAGLSLMRNINPTRRALITTGRISSEMLQKAVRMGAQFVISRTSPSSLSIALAEEWDITLIGYARRNRFNLYTHPERILMQDQVY